MITNIMAEIKSWIKEKQNDLVLGLGVFLIAVISFGLGILVQNDRNRAPIVIRDSKYCATLDAVVPQNVEPPTSLPGTYVASKQGKYYHLPDCPGARNISEKNKIWFQTKTEAEEKGYKPASNCPGLEDH